jgi:glycerol kinase
MKAILALDLGTTGNRAIAFSKQGRVLAQSYQEFRQIFPKPGWVEHNPLEIWKSAKHVLSDVISKVGAENISALGITNQRETTILWNKTTGQPFYNAIVWQCRRTQPLCDALKKHEKTIKQKTGLFLDPYFSATKIQWLLRHVPRIQKEIQKENVLFGTVDSWIVWNLTGGKKHLTDVSNASRTLCFNIHTLKWDPQLLRLFKLPISIFPKVEESAAPFGLVERSLFGTPIPITGILGDQQAALFAQGGWQKGVVKNTYGTGLFVVTSTGSKIPASGRLINTVAWKIHGKVEYALEGSIFIGGSALQWLRDGLALIRHAKESEKLATSLPSNEGVYFVPALVGMGAPFWDPTARGAFFGLTRGTKRTHLIRAALEALAFQTQDVVLAMKKTAPSVKLKILRVDGGATHNNFLMQFQADVLNIPVERTHIPEATAFGVAGVAGLEVKFWSIKEFSALRKVERTFYPQQQKKTRAAEYVMWKKAVERTLRWL